MVYLGVVGAIGLAVSIILFVNADGFNADSKLLKEIASIILTISIIFSIIGVVSSDGFNKGSDYSDYFERQEQREKEERMNRYNREMYRIFGE